MANEIPNGSELGNNLASMAKYLGSVASQMSFYSTELGSVKTDVNEVKIEVGELRTNFGDRLTVLEEDEGLKRYQVDMIDRELTIRASNLLGIKWVKGRVADDCIDVKKRYFGRLRAEIIREAKKSIGLSQSIKWAYTPRKYFEKFRQFVREYEPCGGIEEFKSYVDKNAKG